MRRFWKTLSLVRGGATSRYDWAYLLQDEWPTIASVLRPTGTEASRIACPSPGGEHCPRRVRRWKGSIVAVCSDPDFACEDVELTREDLGVLEVDVSRLAEQQLALDLWQRLPRYKPERAGLATFIDRAVRHRVCGFFTAGQAVARSSDRRAISLEGDDEGRRLAARLRIADGLWERADDLEREVGLRHDLARFVASLPPALERCLAILTSGSIGVAARKENLHRSSYYEALDRLRRRARQAGLHEYLGDPDKSENGSVRNHRERPARA